MVAQVWRGLTLAHPHLTKYQITGYGHIPCQAHSIARLARETRSQPASGGKLEGVVIARSWISGTGAPADGIDLWRWISTAAVLLQSTTGPAVSVDSIAGQDEKTHPTARCTSSKTCKSHYCTSA